MYMHHGDGLLEYFWTKCLESGNPKRLPEKAFRYPGIPPQSRETAILTICDAVEAASRSLRQPDARAIEAVVQRIIYGKLHLGQLDQSGLSMTDLRILARTLVETLQHAHHVRIEYPWQRQEAADRAREAAQQSPDAVATMAGTQAARDGVVTQPGDAGRSGETTRRFIQEAVLDSADVPRPYWNEARPPSAVEQSPTRQLQRDAAPAPAPAPTRAPTAQPQPIVTPVTPVTTPPPQSIATPIAPVPAAAPLPWESGNVTQPVSKPDSREPSALTTLTGGTPPDMVRPAAKSSPPPPPAKAAEPPSPTAKTIPIVVPIAAPIAPPPAAAVAAASPQPTKPPVDPPAHVMNTLRGFLTRDREAAEAKAAADAAAAIVAAKGLVQPEPEPEPEPTQPAEAAPMVSHEPTIELLRSDVLSSVDAVMAERAEEPPEDDGLAVGTLILGPPPATRPSHGEPAPVEAAEERDEDGPTSKPAVPAGSMTPPRRRPPPPPGRGD